MQAQSVSAPKMSIAWLAAWGIASAAGIIVGFLATLPLIWSLSETLWNTLPGSQALAGAFFGAGVGLATGGFQWVVLRARGESSSRWVAGTVLGGIVGGIGGMLLSVWFNQGGGNLGAVALAFGFLGAALGAGQLLVGRMISNPLWVVASALGLGFGALFPIGVLDAEFASVVLGGVIYGAVMAAAWGWLGQPRGGGTAVDARA